MVEIKYHRNVLWFLEELTDILIENGYFVKYITNNHLDGKHFT